MVTAHNQLLRLTGMVWDLHREAPADGWTTLDDLISSAPEMVRGAQYAGLTIAAGRHLETPSATGRYPLVLQDIQQRHGEGPCLSAAGQRQAIRIDDLAADVRWPRYRREALRRTPIRSVLMFPLSAIKPGRGALSLYADHAHAFDDGSQDAGRSFAAHVALAWGIIEQHKQFGNALASRDVIGQAKGMLMERFGIEAVDAFGLLARLSQEWNMPASEIAQHVVRAQHPRRKPLHGGEKY